ncbi:probable inactive allantoicase isoform X2 [Rhineura floridana]|uniref:probable inactive allantoicase isoform X2 n=1 Tax=Rhineura floridana TaxID=261503 RepID=UPI002AC7EA19|nr:probable inactive allantoicase isoform X2 [Rhineura floridana]
MTFHPKERKANVLPDFLQLNDLGCETIGGKILFATDDFFAPAENLLKKQRPVFHADLFTEYGKWRDGWETRRKRIPGHDWCIIQLGVPGIIYGFEADTSYFAGNCAPWISVQAACLKPEEVPALPARGNRIGTAASDEELRAAKEMRSDEWTSLVLISEIKSGNLDTGHNYFIVTSKQRWTHLRLNIYPDGGIARLKVYGTMLGEWPLSGLNHLSDLVAMVNGGVCVGYSDTQFGHPGNILGIGKSKSMKDGWETGRNLQRPPVLKVDDKGVLLLPGSEWAVFRLGHSGVITHIEIDTSHFKGNFPDTFKLEACILSIQEENECVTQKWTPKQSPKWNILLPATKELG